MNYITVIMAYGQQNPNDEFDTEVPVAAYTNSDEAEEVLVKLNSGEKVEGVQDDGLYMRHNFYTVQVLNLTTH